MYPPLMAHPPGGGAAQAPLPPQESHDRAPVVRVLRSICRLLDLVPEAKTEERLPPAPATGPSDQHLQILRAVLAVEPMHP
eukprot:CAMPEP_0180679810 /NCGR_PEP_ID=MMETSP1037_2-20121125/69123_1 /TAXON_ID=632150 /ORGANISM="Azadinium spinosum, Strain 3D9" /LENGTH=80 /DNA_ID=CAMNT_0022709563 /DNA_START=138 /DNA_END=381 /DNA_ORIENTATION=-